MSSKKNYIIYILPILFLSLILPSNVNASVIINEFSPSTNPEWIELYNDGDFDVDISGYLLEDGNSIKTDDLILSGTLLSKGFLVFEHVEGWLNNSGDTIKLYNNASSSAIIDQYTYGNVDSTKSMARIPNGSENWEITLNISKNTINPSPTPSPTPEPTSTPEPTNTPTMTSTATSTPSPAPTKTPTIKPTVPSTVKPTDKPNSTDAPMLIGLTGENPTPEGYVLGESNTKKSPFLSIFFIISGLLFMTVGGVNLYKKMKTEYNRTYENT